MNNRKRDQVRHASSDFVPDWASPPGDTLAALLDERSMSQTDLAKRLGVTLKHVNRIVKGAASISAELALGLEKVFGAPASFWMTREAHFQADQARQRQLEQFSRQGDWAAQFPLRELRARGRVSRNSTGAQLVEELLSFFGIATPEDWKEPNVAYRKSLKYQSDPFALSAWLREGELEAAALVCEPYDDTKFLEALVQARSLTRLEPEAWWPALRKLCADAGVAVVAVPAYVGAKANGATQWPASDKALVQLSLRHKWEDIFWFSFFHEAGHVVLHRKKEEYGDLFVESARGPADPLDQRIEDEANRFAARTLIPPPYDKRLPRLSLSDIESFAKAIDVAPAIVVGRLQFDGLLAYSQGNHLRRRLSFSD
jgi:HTH-type transcriptional regulator/antitoxin HigA